MNYKEIHLYQHVWQCEGLHAFLSQMSSWVVVSMKWNVRPINYSTPLPCWEAVLRQSFSLYWQVWLMLDSCRSSKCVKMELCWAAISGICWHIIPKDSVANTFIFHPKNVKSCRWPSKHLQKTILILWKKELYSMYLFINICQNWLNFILIGWKKSKPASQQKFSLWL